MKQSKKQGTRWPLSNPQATADALIAQLRSMANPANVEGMARFGINPENTLGISMKDLRALAKQGQRNHAVAALLWKSGLHEARILASLLDEPLCVSEAQMESWARALNSWDVCDQLCASLFAYVPMAYQKVEEWSAREEEFVKRAGFVLLARLAVSDKQASDEQFRSFLPIIEREASDGRNFVKKAVNWALRQIGKRNSALRRDALVCARRIQKSRSSSARWIAADAIRELEGETVKRMLARQKGKGSHKNTKARMRDCFVAGKRSSQ